MADHDVRPGKEQSLVTVGFPADDKGRAAFGAMHLDNLALPLVGPNVPATNDQTVPDCCLH